MSFSPTYSDWLEPSHGLLSPETWRALLLTSEGSALQAAMDCGRRADARSLTNLMGVFQELGGTALLASGQAQAGMFTTPNYDILDMDVVNDRNRWHERMPTTSVPVDNCSYEFAVALCLSRDRSGDVVTMPVKAFQDTLSRGAPAHKDGLHESEIELLDSAIAAFARVDTFVGIDQQRSGRGVTTLRRLFYEVAGCVSTGEAIDRFAANGHDIAELSRCKIEDHSTYGKTVRTPLEHAVAWGNPEAAVRISEAVGIDKDYGPDHLHKALNATKGSGEIRNFGLMILDEEQRFRTHGAAGDVINSPRMVDILRLAELAQEGKPPRSKLGLTHQTLEYYLDHCTPRKMAFNVEVSEKLVSSIFPLNYSDAQRQEVLQDWVSTRNGATTALRTYLNHSCAPVLELLKPIIPSLMAQEGRDAHEKVLKMVSDLSEGQTLHPAQLKSTLQLIGDLGLDINGPLTTEGRSGATKTTILHRLASSKSPQTVELMLAAVDAGVDPTGVDGNGRLVAKVIQDREIKTSWDVAIRSITAKNAALQALQEIDLGSP